MADIKKLKNYFEKLYSFADTVSSDYRAVVENDVLMFCAYIIAADNKISPKEVKLLSELIDIQVDPENLLKYIRQQSWSEFEHTVPMILEGLLLADIEDGRDYDNSRSKEMLNNLVHLAYALIEVGGKEKIEEQKAAKYIEYLGTEAMERFTKSKGKEKKSSNVNTIQQKKPDPQPTQKKDNEKPQKGLDDGSWTPKSKHVPTGDFLDDLFRDKRLNHEDRVNIWKNITESSLPCVNRDELKFKKPAFFGYEKCTQTINQVFNDYEMDDNKPIYYYGLAFSQPPGKAVSMPAGLLVNHQGIFIQWFDGNAGFIPWDFIEGADKLVNTEKAYLLPIRLSDSEDFDISVIVEEGTNALVLTFIKPGNVPNMTLADKYELENLINIINTRVKQIEPFKDKPFVVECDEWYRYITESEAQKLCQDYLKTKDAKPSKATQSQSSKPDKSAKQAEKKAEAPKPKPASSQPAKKASGEVSIPTTGPTTKLDFWQAFKPYIDQMRHTEFSKVKIKDDDCLDAKATVIVGVYNSILMRVSKNLLRLELYIDTETEAGNLQILDYIKEKIKVPPALKGKIEYERKEGRRAQRVCVSFPDFELSNRSCWSEYITEIMNVADDFFDAVEAPMSDLIS